MADWHLASIPLPFQCSGFQTFFKRKTYYIAVQYMRMCVLHKT